jgi:peptide/nickel transport system substrate-binding protein
MDRRTLLKGLAGVGSLAATGGISMPALSQGASARTLRFVPQANLANFDPIWGTQYVVRNAAALVWDTLYGLDANLQPQRQMVASEEVSDDGLVWTFRLRPGLKFHDGEPVLSKDVVASLTRWSARDPMGLMIKAIQNELTAVDDKTFKWALKQPSEDAFGAGQEQHALRLHHAGAPRPDRPIQADHRLYRLGADEVREKRMGARRQGGV